MTPEQCLRLAILPALTLLPERMNSAPAHALLLAIAMQESWDLGHRRQIRGPARSLWQYEQSGIRGVLDHPASRTLARATCKTLLYPVETQPDGTVTADTVLNVHQAVEHNDSLAAALARLTLWRLPTPLPPRGAPAAAWDQYIEAWRPGKPHRQPWDARYALAWEAVGSLG